MRSLATLLSTWVLVACSTAPVTRGPSATGVTASDAPIEFLLTSAATDFQSQRPPTPVRVRTVRIGYVAVSDGSRQYRLCGDYQPVGESAKSEWTSFATIKTSAYEQWLGAQAAPFCERGPIVWVDGDFTPALQSRLDSPR